MKVLNSKIILTVSLSSLLVACGGATKPEKPALPFIKETALVIEEDKKHENTTAEDWLEKKEFTLVDVKPTCLEKKLGDCTHAYELLNIHKAYEYGLSGEGQTIAIMDYGFNVNDDNIHNEFDSDGKIISYGDLANGQQGKAECEKVSADIEGYLCVGRPSYHGNFVASIAAGNFSDSDDNSLNMMGVAYNANLHISDFAGPNGKNWHLNHWSEAIDDAAKNGAIVINNSWGLDYSLIDAQKELEKNPNLSITDLGLSLLTDTGMIEINEADFNNYIDSLNNFQKQGVIVWALPNVNLGDANVTAGLPELVDDLNHNAWLAVGNVQFVGDQPISESKVGQTSYDDEGNSIPVYSENDNIFHMSAPCGQTASYCLVAKGVDLIGAAHVDGDTPYYGFGSGSSYAAPQVSGGIALLAQAFPNHTPDQLVDRLLASANNSFFTNEETDGKYGITDFGNGVKHKYSYKFGHGFMDLYAALNPIGDKSVLFGKSIDNSIKINFDDSYFLTDKSFGDALQKAFQDDFIVFHDGLNGEFGFKLTDSIRQPASSSQGISLKQLLNQDSTKQPINSFNTNSLTILQPSLYKSLPLQRLYAGFSTIDMPDISYLNSAALGAGINGAVNFADGHLLYSFSQSLESTDNNLGQDKSVVLAYSSNQNSATRAAIATGLSMEQGSLLDSVGSGAWNMDKKQARTNYLAITGEHDLSHDMSLKMMAALGRTHMDQSANTLFEGADGILTNHIDVQLNKQQAFKKGDLLTFKLSQPLRANAGQMTVNMPQGADADGNLHFKQKTIDVKPSGQQLDFGVNYHADINSQFSLGLNSLFTKQANHNKDNPDHYSMSMTMAWDQFKFGLRGEQFEAGDLKRSAQLSFGNQF
ncbi:MAG: hypothetical protein CMH96_00375 [Oceanospirillaceae bacterium]|nr:hypothetical protein [Oceanospirillaceae bacterium]